MTTNNPAITPTESRKNAESIISAIQKAGYTAYFVGGCVRDILMNRTPVDYDISTNALPDEIISLFQESRLVGKKFGVVIVKAGNNWVEVATFRSDHSYSDGRRPDRIDFTDAEHDAQRRDFTINAIFMNPTNGELHDYVNGINDIKEGIVRTVGNPDQRFSEDYLRILRAIRFTSSFNFRMEQHTMNSIKKNAHLVASISMERINNEFSRMLMESRDMRNPILLLGELGIMKHLIPELSELLSTNSESLTRTLNMLHNAEHRSITLIFAILFHTVESYKTTEHVLHRLRFSRKDVSSILECITINNVLTDLHKQSIAAVRTILSSSVIDDALELHRLFCQFFDGNMKTYETISAEHGKTPGSTPLPPHWINGHDLIALGIPKGPLTGKYRNMAYIAQLEGTFQNREELLKWIADEIRSDLS